MIVTGPLRAVVRLLVTGRATEVTMVAVTVVVRMAVVVRMVVGVAVVVRMAVGVAVVVRMAVTIPRSPVGRLPTDRHVEPGRPDPAPVHPFAADADVFQVKRIDCPCERVERHAGIEQRAGDHVARRAREAVEVQDSGHLSTCAPAGPTTSAASRPPRRYRRPCSWKL